MLIVSQNKKGLFKRMFTGHKHYITRQPECFLEQTQKANSEDVPATFQVALGGGNFDGSDSIIVFTNADGIAEVNWTLGPDPGVANNEATADFADNSGFPAVFIVSGVESGAVEDTTVSGIVQDNTGNPVIGARAVIRDTDLEAFTGQDGMFTIANVLPGGHHVGILGSEANDPVSGVFFPDIDFAIEVISGVDNTLDQIVVLPFLDQDSAQLAGGNQNVVLTMAGVSGFSITVFANSTFVRDPDTGELVQEPVELTSSQVRFDRIPMPPPQGSTPLIVGTLQPAGIIFDPPAEICYPNAAALAPGDVADIFAFHHDIGQFVNLGPGTVSEDGSVICSDPGFGIIQSGWYCVIRIPGPTADCLNDCRVTMEWQLLDSNGNTTGSKKTVGPIQLCKGQKAEVVVTFLNPTGGSLDSATWSGGSQVSFSGQLALGPVALVTIEGAQSGTTNITSPIYRIAIPPEDGGDKTCEVEIPVEVYGITIEKVGNTIIEQGNNYSENTTIRASISNGFPSLKVRFIEDTGTTYYDGNDGATDLTNDAVRVIAVSGAIAQLEIKSVSNSGNITGPPDAKIKAELLDGSNNILCTSDILNVDQWVDENTDGFIDWLEEHSFNILGCAQTSSGELASVASTVTGMGQENGPACGTTNRGSHFINISPVCGNPNKHRLNVGNELTDTVLHESRHSQQNTDLVINTSTLVDDDENPATPSNDDDQDRFPESVTFSSANILLESVSGSGDSIADADSSSVLARETDAGTFASTFSNTCQ